MKCKIDGCDRNAHYKAAQLCQKHYFRIRRNGDIELVLDRKKRLTGFSRKPVVVMPGKGYIYIYDPYHPLATSQGYVAEHRKVVFDRYGLELPDCEICGKPTNWETCHIDHIDCVVSNNAQENLRPVCRPCNTTRHYPEQHTIKGRIPVTYNGVTKTAHEWVRELGLNISSSTVRHRIEHGMTAEKALFGEKITHNGRVKKKKPTPPKHTRKNSIAITINGETLTSSEWSRRPECSVSDGAIRLRIKQGWDRVAAVLTPRKCKQIFNSNIAR